MAEPVSDTTHPILGFARALGGALDRVLLADPVFLSPEQQRQVLLALDVQQARLDALRLKVLAAADRNDVGAESGATSTGAWLSHVTMADRSEAARLVKLARALDDRPGTAAGLAAGDFSREHANVMVQALDALPADLDHDLVARAEKTLVEEAPHLTPRQLRIAGRHLLDVVAPDIAEAAEQERLDRLDEVAFSDARLTMRSLGDGTTQGWFRLPDLHAAILKTALEAISAPRKTAVEPDQLTGRLPDHTVLRGQAMCELLEHLPVDGYGEHGGLAATLVVTLDHRALIAGLGVAALIDGAEISAGEARRLACGAGIIPAVLDGASTSLDVGREQRLFTRAQRIALNLRDKGCRAETCDRPPTWCEAHHLDPWSTGGRTDLDNGVLLCGHHHRLIHHCGDAHQRLPDGTIRFHLRR